MNKRLAILGAGESGIGAALLAVAKGYEVFVSDSAPIGVIYKKELEDHNIPYEERRHTTELILSAGEVIKSPGIPEKAPIMKTIRAKKIPVISEIEFAYRHRGNGRIVGITGSNGKTTVTSLIFHICTQAGMDCALVGNIGYSFARQIYSDPRAWYIAEISSFQLDDISAFKPDIAILNNITEDHLDRYENQFEKYINSKFRIAMNQTKEDYFIYCEDDPVTMQYISRYSINANLLSFTMHKELNRGAFIMNGQMTIKTGTEKMEMSIYDFAIKGKHNQYNTMASGIAASILGIRKENIRDSMQSFEALEHRMEPVVSIRGVDFINDSKATNVNSVWFALESMKKPTILILGGIDKGNDYSIIRDLVREKVKAIVCMGVDNSKIQHALEKDVPVMVSTSSAVDAVKAAFSMANPGDVILLSPACASFDLFLNYEDRGTQFKKAARDL